MLNTRAMITPQYLNAMKNQGIRFTEEDMIFTVPQACEQFIFLENGNRRSGLTHIQLRHTVEFEGFNIPPNSIAQILHNAIYGEHLLIHKNRERIIALYSANNLASILVVMGTNGYIVTAWPITRMEAEGLCAEEERAWRVKCNEPRSGACSGITEYSPFEEYVSRSMRGPG